MIYLLIGLIVSSSLFVVSGKDTLHHANKNEFILCRKCGADIADSAYIINKISPGAKRNINQSLFSNKNVTVQTLVNPLGIKFDIVTVEKVNCYNVQNVHDAESWFPGYIWRICRCPYCSEHLGWTFERISGNLDEAQSFSGLILNKILEERFTNFLVLPKMYRL